MQVQLAAGFANKHCACEHTQDMSSLPARLICMQVCHSQYLSRACRLSGRHSILPTLVVGCGSQSAAIGVYRITTPDLKGRGFDNLARLQTAVKSGKTVCTGWNRGSFSSVSHTQGMATR